MPFHRIESVGNDALFDPNLVQGEENEPAFMAEVAQTVADILEMDEAELASKLAVNTRNLFG